MMSGIKKQLLLNKSLGYKLEELLAKIEVNDSNQRNMLLIGFLRNALSHYHAMNILIEKKLYNSAFALVRVFFENIIRGYYMYHFFDDTKISKMYKDENWDKYFFKKMNST